MRFCYRSNASRDGEFFLWKLALRISGNLARILELVLGKAFEIVLTHAEKDFRGTLSTLCDSPPCVLSGSLHACHVGIDEGTKVRSRTQGYGSACL